MAKANLTLQLDEDVIRRARIVAAKRGTSVSALVARELDGLVEQDARYEEARGRAEELMRGAAPRRGRAWRRDGLHDRWCPMTAGDLTFVDTKVLAHAHDRSETRKQPLAQALLERLSASRTGTLSTQILQEFYVVATRKFDPPMAATSARPTQPVATAMQTS